MTMWDKAPCLKCGKMFSLNAAQVCKECSSRPCHWCGTTCKSKLDKPTCNRCSKKSLMAKQAMREKTTATKAT